MFNGVLTGYSTYRESNPCSSIQLNSLLTSFWGFPSHIS